MNFYSCTTFVHAQSGNTALASRQISSPLTDSTVNFTFTVEQSHLTGSWVWNSTQSNYQWVWDYGNGWGRAAPSTVPLLPTFAEDSYIRLQVSTGDLVAECTNCVGVSESTVYEPSSSVQRNVFRVVFGSNYPTKVGLIAWNGNYLTPDVSQTVGTSSTYYKTRVDSTTPYYWTLTVQASTITLYSAERNAYLAICSTCFAGSNIVAAVEGLTGSESETLFTPTIESTAPTTGTWTFDYWANAYRWTWANGGSWGTAVPASPNLPTVLPFPHATGQFVNIQDASGRYLGICPTCTTPTGIFASAFESEVVNFFEVFHVYFIFSNIIL